MTPPAARFCFSFADGRLQEQQPRQGCSGGDRAAAAWVVREPSSRLGSGPGVAYASPTTNTARTTLSADPRTGTYGTSSPTGSPAANAAAAASHAPDQPHRDYRADSGGAGQARAAAHDTYPK